MYIPCIGSPLFKQALHSGGGHLTVKHVEEVSLGALFLMQAARMTDKTFKVKPPSTTHTAQYVTLMMM